MKYLTAIALALVTTVSNVYAHCEIPCGIYDDEMRISMLRENLTTVEKAMKQIVDLSKGSPVDYNQLVRWTVNKEEHATKIQHIVTQYFMTQRLKPTNSDRKAYEKKLSLLHEMLFYAMKTKQSTDTSHVEKLSTLIAEFYEAYFGEAEKVHLEGHH
ncbi:MAG: superoxide dismutase [bacterium]|nr:superoxide dismutase [bacterium]